MCRACARSEHMCHQFVPLVRAFQLLLAQASLAAWSKVCKLEIFTSEPHRLLGFSSSCTEPAEESLTLYLLLVHTHGLGCWADVPSAFMANGINIDLKEKKNSLILHTHGVGQSVFLRYASDYHMLPELHKSKSEVWQFLFVFLLQIRIAWEDNYSWGIV